MSLKAKIEAVIYAAEEPVTLQQLISLLAGEAGAELDHLAAAQRSLPLESSDPADDKTIPLPSEPETLNAEVFDIDELLEDADADDSRAAIDGIQPAAGDTTAAPSAEPDPEPDPESAPAKPAVAITTTAADSAPAAPAGDAATAPAGKVESPAAAEPLTAQESPADERQLARLTRDRERAIRDYFRHLLEELIRDYAVGDRGLEIREVANGFRLATKPEYHDAVRGFAKSLKPPLKLTLQALETLAVVAYKQPITSPEVSEIRGVDSGGVLGSLMARKLVSPAGRKQVIGRPILYKTTKDFLLRFGLKDIAELPSIEEFEKMAGELAETDAIQEEISMPDPNNQSEEAVTGANLREEADATEPQADGDDTPIEAIPVDGRLSGVSSQSEQTDSVDTSAQEAAIQNDEAAARGEGQE